MKVRRWIVAALLFGVLWVFVRGAALTSASVLTNFLVGTAVGLPVAFVFRRLYERDIELGRSFTAIPYIVLYIGVFIKDIIVANFDVAYRVFSPRMPIDPQVVFVPLRVETTLGITTIANSITVTPGTVTLDHDPDANALYVHAIDGRDPESIVKPIRTWENYALEIFDEERTPDDPPPDITVHPPGYPPEPKTAGDHIAVIESEEENTEAESDGTTDGESDDR